MTDQTTKEDHDPVTVLHRRCEADGAAFHRGIAADEDAVRRTNAMRDLSDHSLSLRCGSAESELRSFRAA